MGNAGPQEPARYVPPPVPPPQVDEDLIGDLEGRRREEDGASAWQRFKWFLQDIWGKDI
jgi:hypothetical protein